MAAGELRKYSFKISGRDGDERDWSVTATNREENIDKALQGAMLFTFQSLTQGKAVYGSPGVGCRGPYRVKRIEIEEV